MRKSPANKTELGIFLFTGKAITIINGKSWMTIILQLFNNKFNNSWWQCFDAVLNSRNRIIKNIESVMLSESLLWILNLVIQLKLPSISINFASNFLRQSTVLNQDRRFIMFVNVIYAGWYQWNHRIQVQDHKWKRRKIAGFRPGSLVFKSWTVKNT